MQTVFAAQGISNVQKESGQMKVSIKGSFELDMVEVLEKLAKKLEVNLKKLSNKIVDLEVKVEDEG